MSRPAHQDEAFNLAFEAIGKSARRYPQKTALRILGNAPANGLPQQLSYQELEENILKIASGLTIRAEQQGITRGELILLRLESDAIFALTFFASIAAGFVPVSLSPQLTEAECAFFIKDTGARWAAIAPSLPFPKGSSQHIITPEELLSFRNGKALAAYAETKTDDPAFLIYTSGTSSKPKGVLHAQRTILGRRPMAAGWHQITADDKTLHAGEFNWTYTLGIGLMDPWVKGATASIYSGEKTPTLWPELIREEEITIFAAVPGVYRQMLKYADLKRADFKTLRHALTAGEAMPESLKNEFEAITGAPVYEALGQSEISTYVSTTSGMAAPKGSKGRIQPGRRIAILPDHDTENAGEAKGAITPLPPGQQGRIAIHKSDPGLMLGYWQNGRLKGLPLEGEWFITGDSGEIDDKGYLTHHGRTDEVMNASGYRVSPQEVEAALTSHSAIIEAAVREEQVKEGLSIIAAYLITEPGDQTKDELIKAIEEHIASRLASYKRPKAYHIIDSLPRNRTGKLLRHALKP